MIRSLASAFAFATVLPAGVFVIEMVSDGSPSTRE